MPPGPPPATSEPSSKPNRLLGRYELIGELARGGMGTVYLARHAGEHRFQRLFAIKVLHPHLAEETAFIDMMRDEARIAARIHHPNVVPIIDLGTDGELHYVVMEYVEGPSFATLLRRARENRPPELVVAVVIDSLEGLHAAHTLKDDDGEEIRLVHRDVSPPNILVGADGIGRITDFGIAKAESRISSTRPGIRKGKLQFMSPEQIKESEDLDQRTDVWAAGAVLWNALTGKSLFKGESDAATLHNILEKEVPPPSSEGLHPPSCFDEIILRALSRDPMSRFSTALEMADALRVTAAANGLAGSKHRVARWVTDVFGEELERRRKAIREVAQRGAESDASGLNVLSSRPSNTSPGRLASGSAITLTQLSHIPSFSVETSSSGSVIPPPPPERVSPSEPPDFRQQKRARLWLAIAVFGVALIAVIAMSMGSSSDETSHAASDDQTNATAPPEPPSTAAAPTSTGEPAPASAHAASEAEQAAARAAEERAARAAPRRPQVHTGPTRDSAREPKIESRETNVPASRPLPSPAPPDDFEKNPYLRR